MLGDPKYAQCSDSVDSKATTADWRTQAHAACSHIHLLSLFCEELLQILERLELERIAAGIQKKHGRLLARLVLEAHVRHDDELRARLLELARELFPFGHWKDDAEMPHRNLVTVDGRSRFVSNFRGGK